MLIANPIYDSAFKFLMEDINIAKGIISRIIGYEILEIEFRPQEYSTITSKDELSFLRMDFHAIILNKEKERQKVLIELQKSKQTMDLFRFRRYIGEQYQKIDNIRYRKNKEGEMVEVPEFYPIIVIYFLGYIEDIRLPKVVRLKGIYYDVIKDREINGIKVDFLDKLTHEAYMLQLGLQESNNTSPLERILTLFSKTDFYTRVIEYPDVQSKELESDLLVQESLRRLSRAIVDEKVRKQLEFEEEMETKVLKLFNTLEEKTKALEEKDKVLEEKDRVLQEKDKVIFNFAKMLKNTGLSLEEIHKQTGLSIEEIINLDKVS